MIEINHISKSYGSHKVLDNISLIIEQGKTVSIIGHTGSGKSTLLNCIAGLIPYDAGTITIDGQLVSDVNPKVGMVFQEHRLFSHLNILKNMTLAPIHVLGMNPEEAESKAFEFLNMVGMGELSKSLPCMLSPGQTQRVAIARSLMMNPEYILLDEPTSSLDPVSSSAVIDIIRELKKKNITIVLVTHKIDFAREVSNKIVFMHNGRICEKGTPIQIIDNPQNSETKAFMNYCMSLVYEIKSAKYDYLDLNARIELFCYKYRLRQDQVNTVQLAVEELLNLLPLNEGVTLFISKSTQNSSLAVRATLENKGTDYLSARRAEDDLSYMILSGICETMSEYIDENGTKMIHLEIRD